MQVTGLRELKKIRTREAIANVAAELFRRDGYEATTVDDVARAAMVSKKTVFNYFPTKEDLVFDQADNHEVELRTAIQDRPDGVTILESFRRLCRSRADEIATIRAELAHGSGGFIDLVRSNPSLQRKAHEVNMRQIRALSAALAEEANTPPDDSLAGVLAWTLLGAHRVLYRRLRERLESGAGDATVLRAHRRDVDRVFDQLAAGLDTYPAGNLGSRPLPASASSSPSRRAGAAGS